MMINCYFIFALLEGFVVLLPVIAGVTIALPHPSAPSPPMQLCPARCTCNNTITDCSGLGFHQIPEGLPQHTTALNMSHNRIKFINWRPFLQLSNLREIYLQENQVAFIPHDLTIKLPHLKILDISLNYIACSCPLKQLEKHLQHHQPSFQLINKNKTDCTKYLKESKNRGPTSLEKCILKLRWKRKPSCDSLQCKNGGTCLPNPRPMCQCVPPFHGMFCEFPQDDDRKPGDSDLSVQVLSITSTTIQISWSTAMDFSYSRFEITVQLEDPSISVYREPITTTTRSFTIDDLLPSTSYRICVEEISPERGLFSCFTETTLSYDTTQITSIQETDSISGHVWEDSKVNQNRPPFPRKPDLPHPKGKKDGEEMHYALISVAALFGICLLLTVMIGFVYYKRVHGNGQDETAESESGNNGSADRGADRGVSSTADRGHIVLVTTGNELNTVMGHINATFDPDSVDLSQVSWTETDRTGESRPRKRSVRFDLSNEQGSSQHAIGVVLDDNVDSANNSVDDNTTDT